MLCPILNAVAKEVQKHVSENVGPLFFCGIEIRSGAIQFSIVPGLKLSVFINYIYSSISYSVCPTNVTLCFYSYFL